MTLMEIECGWRVWFHQQGEDQLGTQVILLIHSKYDRYGRR